MVPSGWKKTPLSELTKEKISYGIVQAGPHIPDGVPYIKSSNVGGEIDINSLQKTAQEIHHKYRRSAVHPNDIVFSLRGNIGRTSIVPYSLPEANLTQGTARISVNDTNDMKFVFYQLASTPVINRINALSKGSTFKEISLEELRKVKLPEAPLKEQYKIAQILSTWDKAISTTESLISNSQQQKKSLMQQLLTGKKRFSGFEGQWEEIKLGDLCKFSQGFQVEIENQSEILKPNYERFIRIVDYTKKNEPPRYVKLLKNYYTVEPDDLVMVRYGDAGFLARGYKGVIANNLFLIKAEPTFTSKDFLFEIIKSKYNLISSLAASSTMPAIKFGDIKSITVLLPSLPEQQKIASVLTAANQEIDTLQQQLTNLKQEKKALMQQLLTGKRRVNVDNKTEAT